MFDPFVEGFAADPYPIYAIERNNEPIQQLPFGPWMVFTHAESVRVLRDVSLSVDIQKAIEISGFDPRTRAKMRAEIFPDRVPREDTSILNIDPPDHTRLRKLVSSVFTPKRISELRPVIERIVDEHLDAVVARAQAAGSSTIEMDLVSDLAFPLPFVLFPKCLAYPMKIRRRFANGHIRWCEFLISPLVRKNFMTR